MHTFAWQALGTHWSVLIDTDSVPVEHETVIKDWLADFEQRFSRFLPNSEVNAFRTASPGTYPVSPEFLVLLERTSILRDLTHGRYDPAAGELLERAGYGKSRSTSLAPEDFRLPHWKLDGDKLVVDGPTTFDLGGIGKGYAIDRVADQLKGFGYTHILVEGGGDMFGAEKADGTAWHVAIEYPGKPELAAGTLELRHAGLAVSDRFRRRFGNWHHIVDPTENKPVSSIEGCAAVAPSAWAADCMTSGLFLGTEEQYAKLREAFAAEYLVFLPNGQTTVSQAWPGALFI